MKRNENKLDIIDLDATDTIPRIIPEATDCDEELQSIEYTDEIDDYYDDVEFLSEEINNQVNTSEEYEHDAAYMDAPLEVACDDAYMDAPLEVDCDDAYVDAPLEVDCDDTYMDAPLEYEYDAAVDSDIAEASSMDYEGEISRRDRTRPDNRSSKNKTGKASADKASKNKTGKASADKASKNKTGKVSADKASKKKTGKASADKASKNKTGKASADRNSKNNFKQNGKYGESSVKAKKQDKSRYANPVLNWFSHLELPEYIAIGVGVVIVILVVLILVGLGKRKNSNEPEATNTVSTSSISANITDSFVPKKILEESVSIANSAIEEGKAILSSNEIEVEFTSIEKDIKIKFIDTGSDSLVTGNEFQVKLKPQKGDELLLSDEDTDGIIYKTKIAAGEYQIEVMPMEGYSFKEYASSITVKDKIAYEQVDVSKEIKKESEINVAAEDTAVTNKEAEAEAIAPVVSDTVEFIESTKTPISTEGEEGYQGIGKDDIESPSYALIDRIDKKLELYAAWERTLEKKIVLLEKPEGEEPEESTEPSEEESTEPSEEPTEEPASEEPTTEPSKEPTKEPSAEPSGIKESASPSTKPSASPSISPTPSAPIAIVQSISISPTEMEVFVEDDKTIEVTVKLEDGTKITDATKCSFESKDEKIATVSSKGKVEGIKEGKTTVTVTYKDEKGNAKSATCEVKVIQDPKKDNKTKLKDKNGNQVYIKKDGKFVEAVYADYYTATDFYIMGKQEYKYTGWQTIDGNVYYFDKDGRYVVGEQIIQGVKYTFNAEGILAVNSSGSIGIDVSKWNGSIDWNAVKNSGVSYVIIRCGYRGSSTGVLVEDPKFKNNISGASAAGLKVGIYFYTQAVSTIEAVEEASMVLSQVRGYSVGYPIFIDTEKSGGRADGIDRNTRTAVCVAFCETIRNGGYTPGVYASKSWFNDKLNYSQLSGYKIWLAQYAPAPTFASRYDIWQHTEKGTVSGISGKVDMNISYMGY